ncbi:MAG TPA: hypothetical protein VGB89_11255 [Bacteroidota bacterium]
MKQTLFALLLFTTFAGSIAYSQNRPNPAERMDRTMVMLTKQLLLSMEQQKTIRQILTESNKELANARKENVGKPELVRTEMQKIRANSDARIEEILNNAQKTAFEKYKERRKSRMRDRTLDDEGRR